MRMKYCAAIMFVIHCFCFSIFSQTTPAIPAPQAGTPAPQASSTETGGTISGKVTLGGKAASGVAVVLRGTTGSILKADPQATTDDAGMYRFEKVPAGTYNIVPLSPIYVVPNGTTTGDPGRTVTLNQNENMDGINLSLTMGGVITGKITNADGEPLIGEKVRLRYARGGGFGQGFQQRGFQRPQQQGQQPRGQQNQGQPPPGQPPQGQQPQGQLTQGQNAQQQQFRQRQMMQMQSQQMSSQFQQQMQRAQQPQLLIPGIAETDDRGIFRIFGLPAGQYIVSVGESKSLIAADRNQGRSAYPETFHPNAPNTTAATVITVNEGGEVTNVDIKLPKLGQIFLVSGRFIEDDTGLPAPSVVYACSSLDDTDLTSATADSWITNSKGEFAIPGLLPGRYSIMIRPDPDSIYLSTPVNFEVTTGDVSNIEVKVRPAASISGMAFIEGNLSAVAQSMLSQMMISASGASRVGMGRNAGRINMSSATINTDGSFFIPSLRPGKVRLNIFNTNNIRGFRILRVEQDGNDVTQAGVDVTAGQSVSGVTVYLQYLGGNGRIRGQVNVIGGTLPTGTRMNITSILNSGDGSAGRGGGMGSTVVDSVGRFTLDQLAEGTYQVILIAMPGRGSVNTGAAPTAMYASQTVTVADGAETPVVLTLDLASPQVSTPPAGFPRGGNPPGGDNPPRRRPQ